jgi:CubicO group peptidase (beta-lactamase class C family)
MTPRPSRKLGLFALALAIAVSVAPTRAQPQQAGLSAAAIAEIDTFIRTEQTAAKVPGMSLAIAFHHQFVYSKGFGFADLEQQAPATAETVFRTASIAKPITATAVMKLVERGRLDLDAPIQKYCAAFPIKQWPVTARLILAHLAGIRHYKPGESGGKTHYFSIEDSLALFRDDPLLHQPGTKYFYSTFGYSVLGCAIEHASGMSYEEFMRKEVWAPAGMTRTRLDRIWDIVPDRARGYYLLSEADLKSVPAAARAMVKSGDVINAPLHDTSMKIPGGGLLSTSEDLVRFGIALQTGTLVKKETLELMWTEGRTTSGEATGYGFGWGVQPPQEGLRRISHSGNQIGASGGIIIIPEVQLTYVVLTNLEDVDIPKFTRGVAQILRKHLMR